MNMARIRVRSANGILVWTHEDDVLASQQGWSVWECDGSENGQWQIQRVDEAEIFPSDDAAWAHVIMRALCGDALCLRAIAFIKAKNPIEYKAYLGDISLAA